MSSQSGQEKARFLQNRSEAIRKGKRAAKASFAGDGFTLDPLQQELPLDPHILSRAKKLLSESNTRADTLAELITHDPILTLELLGDANSAILAPKIHPVKNTLSAIIRVGSAHLAERFRIWDKRKHFANQECAQVFEQLRLASRETSALALIIARIVKPKLTQDAQTLGLMTNIGHMLACSLLGPAYVVLRSRLNSRTLAYRIASTYDLHLKTLQARYLRDHSFPEKLLLALDRDSLQQHPHLSELCFIIESAVELHEAYENKKWKNYSSSTKLPPHSALRLLGLRSEEYELIYKLASKYLGLCSHHAGSAAKRGKSPFLTKSLLVLIPELEEPRENTKLQTRGELPDDLEFRELLKRVDSVLEESEEVCEHLQTEVFMLQKKQLDHKQKNNTQKNFHISSREDFCTAFDSVFETLHRGNLFYRSFILYGEVHSAPEKVLCAVGERPCEDVLCELLREYTNSDDTLSYVASIPTENRTRLVLVAECNRKGKDSEHELLFQKSVEFLQNALRGCSAEVLRTLDLLPEYFVNRK